MCSVDGKNLKLEYVQVAFRHGFRSTLVQEAALNNVTDPSIYGPEMGLSQLTITGKQQMFTLGTLLRRTYDAFLGPHNPNELYALSSNYDRTKMSLQLVLAGLYPVSPENKWNDILNWNPIPFRHTTSKYDVLLTPHSCPNYLKEFDKEVFTSKDYQTQIPKFEKLLKFLEEKINYPDAKLYYYAGWTYYALKIHKEMNLPLPAWYTDEIFKSVEEFFAFGLDCMSISEKLKRLNGGIMVRQFIENLKLNEKEIDRKKICLYSTHDLTLASFTRVQNIETFRIPPFGSAIIFEKYKDSTNKHEYIRALSWNGSDDFFETLKLGDCEEFCPLPKYLKMVEKVIPSIEELEYLESD